jgi:hypothetical protein
MAKTKKTPAGETASADMARRFAPLKHQPEDDVLASRAISTQDSLEPARTTPEPTTKRIQEEFGVCGA